MRIKAFVRKNQFLVLALLAMFSISCAEETVSGTAPELEHGIKEAEDADPNIPTPKASPESNEKNDEGNEIQVILIDFQTIELGTESTIVYDIKNSGRRELEVEILPDLDTEAVFSVDQTGKFKIKSGEGRSLPLKITFKPAVTGEFDRSQILVKTNDNGKQLLLKLKGKAIGPEIEVCIPDSFPEVCNDDKALVANFEQKYGAQSLNDPKEQIFVVKNKGTSNLVIGSIAPSASTSPEFTVKEGAVSETIAPGQEFQFTVIYRPVDGGFDLGIIEIKNNDGDENPLNIQVRGAGDAAKICVDPFPVIDFGNVPEGRARRRFMTISNCGYKQQLTIQKGSGLQSSPSCTDSLDPSLPCEFTETNLVTYPVNLSQGEEIEVELKFEPQNLGAEQWFYNLKSTDPVTKDLKVELKGKGVDTKTCELDVIPRKMDFGGVAIQKYTLRDLYLSNLGLASCEITNITEPQLGEYSIVDFNKLNFPIEIPQGGSLKLQVRYEPQDVGLDEDVIKIESNYQDEPEIDVSLRADGGVPPECKILTNPGTPFMNADGELNFGTVERARRKIMKIKVKNIGSDNCIIQRVNENSSPVYRVTNLPAADYLILPGLSYELEVSFKPDRYDEFSRSKVDNRIIIQTTDVSHQSNFPNTLPGEFVIILYGKSRQPNIEAVPRDVNFGLITLGCQSPEEEVRIYNTGSEKVNITSIGLEPGNKGFRIETVCRKSSANPNNCRNFIFPGRLAKDEYLEVKLSWTPKDNSTAFAVLKVESDDPVTPVLTVPLRGVPTTNAHQVDIFSQRDKPLVDILFTIDNSGSMSSDQTNLGKAFTSFIQEAEKQSADYQISTVSTDVDSDHERMSSSGWPNLKQEIGIIWGNPKIITPQTPDRENAFKKNAKVGTSGSASEKGLAAAKLVLTSPQIDDPAFNGGFLREDAKLVIVVVSDEEDQSSAPVDFYTNFFLAIKGARNKQLFDFHAIVNLPTNHPDYNSSVDGTYTRDHGQRYVDVSKRTGGKQFSIGNSDWGAKLGKLAELAFGLRTEFSLSRQPDPTSIEVDVNNQRYSTSGQPDKLYSYDSAANTVFFPTTSVPPKGATIKVEYDTICIPPKTQTP